MTLFGWVVLGLLLVLWPVVLLVIHERDHH